MPALVSVQCLIRCVYFAHPLALSIFSCSYFVSSVHIHRSCPCSFLCFCSLACSCTLCYFILPEYLAPNA
ncbi:hypothetical protein R3P38DRAFT_1704154 [Favolaschia claudopus]|uniref:Uncharacterized protein n=1 Tax=Favolaschia claudopus TaxID=2862362 RepID=A0AAW0AAJ7_9AGAR